MSCKSRKSHGKHRDRVDAAAANRQSGAEQRRSAFKQRHPVCSCAECISKASAKKEEEPHG